MIPMKPPTPDVPPAPTSTVALIPLRTGGKSRLRGTLDAQRRSDLVLAMLDDVLSALRAADITDVRVLAGDHDAASAAAARHLDVVRDPESDDPTMRPDTPADAARGDGRLRGAVDAGLKAVDAGSIRIIVAADLPLLRASDIRALLGSTADVTVAPTRSGGTALLRLGRGVVIPARYGPGSAAAHLTAAAGLGLRAESIDLPGARTDVDAAADLEAFDSLDAPLTVGDATASFLAAPRG